jgi:lipid-A-disaccharide synthase
MAALSARRPELRFTGIGGEQMAARGLATLFPMRELALMGFLEVLPKIALIRRRIRETIADIHAHAPDVVVTIDAAGFNMRVLRGISGLGIKRAHFVAPQIWAWREGRAKHYPGLWDQLLCILPFEPAVFARHGLPATFVGHPVLESGAGQGDAARFHDRHPVPAEMKIVTVMPGSRRGEIARHMDLFRAAAERLGVQAVIPVPPTVAGEMRNVTAGWTRPPIVITDPGEKYDAFAASHGAIVKSGTSTLEVAMAGVPMVVAYRANPLTATIARRLVKVKYASILNLLADRAILPELIQQDCTAQAIAETLGPLLTDHAAARAQIDAAQQMLARLRPASGTPSEAAAEAVLALLPG